MTHPYGRKQRGIKSLLMKIKESEKAGLKLNIQKTQIMSSGPITWWQIDGETMETVTDFLSLGCKITADGDCSHEIKRCLLFGRKAMTNLDNILKNRHYFADKGPYNQSYVVFFFFQFMYGCEIWTIKKTEDQRIDAFELWCWRSLLRVPWTSKISNQSILKEINPEYSLEGLMLMLKLQNFGHLIQKANLLEKIDRRRRRDRQRMKWLDGIIDSMDMNLRWWKTGKPGMLQFLGLQSPTWLSNWTTTTKSQMKEEVMVEGPWGIFLHQWHKCPPCPII